MIFGPVPTKNSLRDLPIGIRSSTRRLWNCSGNCGMGSRYAFWGSSATSKLSEEGEPEQMNLFDFQADQEEEKKREMEEQKRQKLDQALSKIRRKYGENVIRKGRLPEEEKKPDH